MYAGPVPAALSETLLQLLSQNVGELSRHDTFLAAAAALSDLGAAAADSNAGASTVAPAAAGGGGSNGLMGIDMRDAHASSSSKTATAAVAASAARRPLAAFAFLLSEAVLRQLLRNDGQGGFRDLLDTL